MASSGFPASKMIKPYQGHALMEWGLEQHLLPPVIFDVWPSKATLQKQRPQGRETELSFSGHLNLDFLKLLYQLVPIPLQPVAFQTRTAHCSWKLNLVGEVRLALPRRFVGAWWSDPESSKTNICLMSVPKVLHVWQKFVTGGSGGMLCSFKRCSVNRRDSEPPSNSDWYTMIYHDIRMPSSKWLKMPDLESQSGRKPHNSYTFMAGHKADVVSNSM